MVLAYIYVYVWITLRLDRPGSFTVSEHKTYAFSMKVSELCIMASFDNQYNIRILIFVRMEIHVGTIR